MKEQVYGLNCSQPPGSDQDAWASLLVVTSYIFILLNNIQMYIGYNCMDIKLNIVKLKEMNPMILRHIF